MKISEEIKKYRGFKASDLESEIAKAKRELDLLRLEIRANKGENYAKIADIRKKVARLMTILAENSKEKNDR